MFFMFLGFSQARLNIVIIAIAFEGHKFARFVTPFMGSMWSRLQPVGFPWIKQSENPQAEARATEGPKTSFPGPVRRIMQ